jgi:hypothetical protein
LALGKRIFIESISKTVHAYRSLTAVQFFEEHDLLDAGDVLPGFSVAGLFVD